MTILEMYWFYCFCLLKVNCKVKKRSRFRDRYKDTLNSLISI